MLVGGTDVALGKGGMVGAGVSLSETGVGLAMDRDDSVKVGGGVVTDVACPQAVNKMEIMTTRLIRKDIFFMILSLRSTIVLCRGRFSLNNQVVEPIPDSVEALRVVAQLDRRRP